MPHRSQPPLPTRAVAGPSALAPLMAEAIAPRTLLLVEDSRFAAEAVRLLCRRVGIRLRRADSLASAALHLKVYRPDIALIDLGLPDGSGLDLIAALERSSMRPHRLVAVSGDTRMEDAALDAGADAFLLKPISLARHLAALTGARVVPPSMIRAPEATRDDEAGREAPGDPLALRDDLRLVRDLLNGPPDRDRLRYAGQLLASIGRAMRDSRLAEAAQTAADSGDRPSLIALTDRPLHKGALL
ncbi:MAG TPA: response regulator [Pararhodobacter sp.]|uniref:response regulator n=1 Tax=Pararhodobacter sp. TaxID=2127056 RepID=UPI001DD9C17E|nr:response regulator [Pararhodobacter sp.]MCB1347069.1 response regulator [Paracoccaceae bacterium]HPD93116.1 response regulator [Pararhodobacter sp.]